jgi:hypothetical protein
MTKRKAKAVKALFTAKEVREIKTVIVLLMSVAEHDWRISHLAHTSDTAHWAASWLRVILSRVPVTITPSPRKKP